MTQAKDSFFRKLLPAARIRLIVAGIFLHCQPAHSFCGKAGARHCAGIIYRLPLTGDAALGGADRRDRGGRLRHLPPAGNPIPALIRYRVNAALSGTFIGCIAALIIIIL